jgi:peptide deformylase
MILMDDIIREGHDTLREVASEVELPASEEDKKTLEEMISYLYNSQDQDTAEQYGLRAGVGLAAPQINVPKRMIAVLVNDGENEFAYGLMNPKIISHSEELIALSAGEGCLSVDREVEGFVPRFARITVSGTDLNGEPVQIRLRDYLAIVFQHEIDHLNGVMFFDHIDKNDPWENKGYRLI